MNTVNDISNPPLGEVIQHYGVKGMRWGVRRSQEELDRAAGRTKDKPKKLSPEKKKKLKEAALIAGTLVLTAGAVYAKHILNQQGDSSTDKLSDSTTKRGSDAADKTLEEPVDILWATRGVKKGFRFQEDGGLSNPVSVYEDAFGPNADKIPSTNEYFEELENGGVAVSFPDPEGRKDFSGRTIPHNIIIPPPMAENIKTIEDVERDIWPQLSDAYDKFYEESKNTL